MFRKIGTSIVGAAAAFGASSVLADEPQRAPTEPVKALSPKEFTAFPLLTKKIISHDTQQLTFGLPSSNHVTGMNVASLIVTRFIDADGKEVTRPYTPISKTCQKGSFDLLVKKYEGGKMSTHLHEMQMGDTLDVKGPYGKIKIEANQFDHLGMIAGGTGLTPMYQILRHLLDNPEDKTAIAMLYANKSVNDILLASELEHMTRMYNHRFKLYFVVETAPQHWNQGIGYINASMVKAYMPKPGEERSRILVCGPPGMMKAISGDKDYNSQPPKQGALTGLLKELGYSEKDVYKF
eukprot:TRINITY_DN11526_c0_g1_i1.p2 TRINITY_DN11526_c0_g1~~TRINITY_DN11526_c0_g1_i1.p2  ORF type:complete len:306 (+),score=107.49 TRINITY_DN11526_c0_g1_i1:38-919(+)